MNEVQSGSSHSSPPPRFCGSTRQTTNELNRLSEEMPRQEMPISNRPRVWRIPSGPHRREEKISRDASKCVYAEWENTLMELISLWLEWSRTNGSAVESGRLVVVYGVLSTDSTVSTTLHRIHYGVHPPSIPDWRPVRMTEGGQEQMRQGLMGSNQDSLGSGRVQLD